MLLLLGCAVEPVFVVDVGHFDAGDWVSDGTADVVVSGEGAVRDVQVELECRTVVYTVAVNTVVSVPAPGCGASPPDGRWMAEDLEALRALGVIPDWRPGAEAEGVWLTYAEAVQACGFWGMRIAGEASGAGEAGVWVADGVVAGGRWGRGARVPPGARDHTIGIECQRTRY